MLTAPRPQLSSAANRKREADRIRKERQRERERQQQQAIGPVMFARADWRLFIDRATLPQKAGCEPQDIARAVLKELVDNALDEGATVLLSYAVATKTHTITDNGRGIEPEDVPQLFAVNREMVSSKLGRRPLRGMLGNGLRVVMGAVAAYSGSITVTSRSRRQILSVDRATGLTHVTLSRPYISRGTTIEISLPIFTGSEHAAANSAIVIAGHGQASSGPSRPEWYGTDDMRALFGAVMSETAAVGHVVSQIFGITIADDRPVRGLTASDVQRLHTALLSRRQPAVALGYIGANVFDGYQYHRVTDTATINGATIPFVVECWAFARRAEQGDGAAAIQLWVNRSPSLARLYASSASTLHVRGCTLDLTVRSAKKARYSITLSIIAPYLRLANDGKSPVLADFRAACDTAISRATGAAYRLIARPPRDMSLIDAAWQIMEQAYRAVADNPGGYPLPANARQIMYKARPLILALTGAAKFSDSYFTQHLLPDFIAAHPALFAAWDVVYDARGHVTEPHTGRIVPLGTLAVRQYLGERPPLETVAEFPTIRPMGRKTATASRRKALTPCWRVRGSPNASI
jgi:hypothetical protein